MTDARGPSTYPVAKASLHRLMKACRDLAGTTVDYGDPGVARIDNEHVFMGGTGDNDNTWAPAGRLARDEKYGIELFIHVARPGHTQQQATERAFELLAVVEALIRPLARTSTIVAPGMYAIELRFLREDPFITDQGYASFITAQLFCQARI